MTLWAVTNALSFEVNPPPPNNKLRTVFYSLSGDKVDQKSRAEYYLATVTDNFF